MIIERPRPDKLYIPLDFQRQQVEGGAKKPDVTFVGTLQEFMSDVNNQQIESSESTEKFIKGDPIDIHDVMISAEKAKTTFQLLMELRNKGLDLYREALRMQV